MVFSGLAAGLSVQRDLVFVDSPHGLSMLENSSFRLIVFCLLV